MSLFTILKFIKIGKMIFDMTSDSIDIVNDKTLSNRDKGIEILKTIPDNLLEMGKTDKKEE